MTETNGTEALSLLTIEHARELLLQHVARLGAEQYWIGRIFNEVVDKRLAGVRSNTAAMSHLGPTVRGLSEREVSRAQAAARRFSEAACMKYGVRRLSVLVRYGERFKRQWAGGALDQMAMRVPDEAGNPREKPFPECTPEEVGRALSRDSLRQAVPVPRLDEYCVHLLREGVRKRFAEDSSASIRAFAREGRMHVTLKNVSVTELKMLAYAIFESTAPLEQEAYRQALAARPRSALSTAPSSYCSRGAAASGSTPRALSAR
jgi:hypothetical protein